MRIAITDLKDYNEGILRFEWLDLEEYSSVDEISEFISKFLQKRSVETGELHEEWFVTDYEEFVNLGEYPDLVVLAEAVRLSKEFSWQAVAGYYNNCQELENFEEAYTGTYENFA